MAHGYSTPMNVLCTLMCCISLFHIAGRQPGGATCGNPIQPSLHIAVQMDFAINIFLVVEREVVCNVSSVFQAVKVLLASYFVSYPNLLGGLFVCKFRCLSQFHSYV